MANLSLRMCDDLKRKAQKLASKQGVSLNNFINSTIAASVAQEEVLRFFDERLRHVDVDELQKRVLDFMKKTTPGDGPTSDEVRQALGGMSCWESSWCSSISGKHWLPKKFLPRKKTRSFLKSYRDAQIGHSGKNSATGGIKTPGIPRSGNNALNGRSPSPPLACGRRRSCFPRI